MLLSGYGMWLQVFSSSGLSHGKGKDGHGSSSALGPEVHCMLQGHKDGVSHGRIAGYGKQGWASKDIISRCAVVLSCATAKFALQSYGPLH